MLICFLFIVFYSCPQMKCLNGAIFRDEYSFVFLNWENYIIFTTITKTLDGKGKEIKVFIFYLRD